MENVIDIHSKGEYPANELSNFYAHHFVFDGVACASMEGFLQSLKFKNLKKQKKVCYMVGKEAKLKGQRKFLWKLFGNLYWQGEKIKRNKNEYLPFVLSAYKAMCEQNQNFKNALINTKGKTLKHSIGKSNPQTTVLTEREFIYCLNVLRAEIK